jgi:hypothetical protein
MDLLPLICAGEKHGYHQLGDCRNIYRIEGLPHEEDSVHRVSTTAPLLGIQFSFLGDVSGFLLGS